jgi:hypothetical protein
VATGLRIGIDFDNTVAGYDRAFTLEARRAGWLAPGSAIMSKRAVREAVRALADGETKWQMLQARVYGPGMPEAEVIDGVNGFLERCAVAQASVFIVSHKTRYAHFDPGGVDLREAARAWIAAQRLPLPLERVFFEETRAAKLARIGALGCTHFIDDLEEVFAEQAFPKDVERFLLSAEEFRVVTGVHLARSWHDITAAIFG